jgi:ribosome-binding protein aMBF1 (putative translation factor)
MAGLMDDQEAEEVEEEDFEEEEDFLDELMREGTAKNPYFPEMVDAQTRKYELLEALDARREALCLSRAEVAKRLDITADELESIERGEANPRLAQVMHLAFILGQTLELRLAPASEETPSSV